MSAMPTTPNLTPDQKHPVGPATWLSEPLPFHCRKCNRLVSEGLVVLTGKPHECDPAVGVVCNPVPAECFK